MKRIKNGKLMKARIDHKVVLVKIVNADYDTYYNTVEVLQMDGKWAEYGAIVNEVDLYEIKPKKAMMKDVYYHKGLEYDIWKGFSEFWVAEYEGMILATLCRTKKECMDEARRAIRKMNGGI